MPSLPTTAFLFIGLLVVMLHGCRADSELEERRMCGRLLINTLKSVCNHNYVQPTKAQLHDNYYRTVFSSARVKRSRSIRRGIIFDCCTNKCSIRYIRTYYCASSPPQSNTQFSIEK